MELQPTLLSSSEQLDIQCSKGSFGPLRVCTFLLANVLCGVSYCCMWQAFECKDANEDNPKFKCALAVAPVTVNICSLLALPYIACFCRVQGWIAHSLATDDLPIFRMALSRDTMRCFIEAEYSKQRQRIFSPRMDNLTPFPLAEALAFGIGAFIFLWREKLDMRHGLLLSAGKKFANPQEIVFITGPVPCVLFRKRLIMLNTPTVMGCFQYPRPGPDVMRYAPGGEVESTKFVMAKNWLDMIEIELESGWGKGGDYTIRSQRFFPIEAERKEEFRCWLLAYSDVFKFVAENNDADDSENLGAGFFVRTFGQQMRLATRDIR